MTRRTAQRNRRGRRFLASLARTSLGALVTGSLLLGQLASPTSASAATHDQDSVKVAYLFNFARYVEWPSSAFDSSASPIQICVIGSDEFVSFARKSLGDRSVQGRPIRVEPRGELSSARGCHMLYLPEAQGEYGGEVIHSLAEKSVLTVASTEGFAKRGGIINFKLADRKLRFVINPEAAQRAGLKVSSKLLRIAEIAN